VTFEVAARVADAVLLEGYVLYPYRASSAKNRYRWTFGVLAPRVWSEAGGCEPWWLRAEVPFEREGERARDGDDEPIRGVFRFLRVLERRVQARGVTSSGESWVDVEELAIGDEIHVSWEEGEIAEIPFTLPPDGEPRIVPIDLAPTSEVEILRDAAGNLVGRVFRTRTALSGRIEACAGRVTAAPNAIARVAVRVENLSPCPLGLARADAVRSAFVSSHVLLAAGAGRAFVSVVDPPEHALAAAGSCSNIGVHPVLAGKPGRRDLVLASPIILYDHPAIAPESPGDFCDAGEIDELLALRTRTLTPAEQALARATDPRAAEIVDRAVGLADSDLARLHGAVRDWNGLGSRFRPGLRVRLRPDERRRRTDVQDMLFAGRTATVEAVREDVDGTKYLAVTLDDDPAIEMHRAKGRFHYYYPDEVEPL
jgi:hypothetical protein